MKVDPSKFVGEIPVFYDRCLGPVIFDDFASDLARRAAALGPSNVLELAAGTGIVSRKLRDALPSETRLVVTDLNPPMLDVARAKFVNEANIEFARADAMALDFSDRRFDLIVCQFGVMFFPDKIASFQEALRVLRPGGTYLFNTWRENMENPFSQIALRASEAFFPDDPPQFYKAPFSYPDAKTVCEDMAAAGFRNIGCEIVALQKDVKNWGAFARGLVYGNAIIDEIKFRGGVDPDDVARAVEHELREAFGPEPGPMPLNATVFWGQP